MTNWFVSKKQSRKICGYFFFNSQLRGRNSAIKFKSRLEHDKTKVFEIFNVKKEKKIENLYFLNEDPPTKKPGHVSNAL